MEGETKGTERVIVYKRERTHETKVALLAEVTDWGGRLSVGLEEVEREDADAPLRRLVDVSVFSDEEG